MTKSKQMVGQMHLNVDNAIWCGKMHLNVNYTILTLESFVNITISLVDPSVCHCEEALIFSKRTKAARRLNFSLTF